MSIGRYPGICLCGWVGATACSFSHSLLHVLVFCAHNTSARAGSLHNPRATLTEFSSNSRAMGGAAPANRSWIYSILFQNDLLHSVPKAHSDVLKTVPHCISSSNGHTAAGHTPQGPQPSATAAPGAYTTAASKRRHRSPVHPAAPAPPHHPSRRSGPDAHAVGPCHRAPGRQTVPAAKATHSTSTHHRHQGSSHCPYRAQAPLTARAELLLLLLCWPDGSTASTCDMEGTHGSSCVLLCVHSQLQLTHATTAIVLWVLPVECLLGVTLHQCTPAGWFYGWAVAPHVHRKVHCIAHSLPQQLPCASTPPP